MDKIIRFLKSKYGNKKWILFLEQLFDRYNKHDTSETGAQLTYYLVLSIFPFIIFFLNLLNFTPLTSDMALQELLAPLPSESQSLLSDLINDIMDASSVTLLSFAAIGTIWSSSQGITSVIKAVNRSLNLEEDRPFWKLRGLAIIFTFGLAIILLITLLFLVFGETIFKSLFPFSSLITRFIWKVLKIIIPLGFMVLIFSLLYKFSPSIKEDISIKYKDALPGSVFTSIGWIVSSILFSFYINNFGNYDNTYGSLGGLIILLVWINMSSIILVLGAEVNATLISMKNKNIEDQLSKS